MALDLGDVRQSTHREPEELPVESARNRLANARFPDSRGTYETNDLALDSAAEFSDRKKFEDAVFDILQTVVIFVQHLDRMGNGVVLLRVLAPRDL